MNQPVFYARVRLVCLWLSQVARVLADNALRMYVVLELGRASRDAHDAAWHQVNTFYYTPFILLAPINGALANTFPKRAVLAIATLWCLLIGVACALGGVQLPLGMALTGLGMAIYSPTRYALLPAAAVDTQVPLSRVNGLIELGGAGAVAAGVLLGIQLHEQTVANTIAAPIALAVLLNAVGACTAMLVTFPSDVRRVEPLGQAVVGFFRDLKRILQNSSTRWPLLGQAAFMAVATTGSGALFAFTTREGTANGLERLPVYLIAGGVGVALGSGLAALQGHRVRSLGLVPLAALGLLAALVWVILSSDLLWPCVMLGIFGGLANVPLRSAYQEALPEDARGNGMAVLNLSIYCSIALLSGLLARMVHLGSLSPTGQFACLAGLAGLGAIIAWCVLLRETIEQLIELLLWPIYRISSYGPGRPLFPRHGPVLVIANHTSYLDPLWLGKVVPRHLTPMMTSVFYDRPVLRWLMRSVVRAIRVEAATFRREVPELRQAVAALDRGECLVIFPEGMLRRKEEKPLRKFGQGVWHVLRERPKTPVVVCWIEGGWGSYFSYRGGTPGVNKRFDWFRRIDIAVNEPQTLDSQLLEDHQALRHHLMESCRATRQFIDGLTPLPTDRTKEEDTPTDGD